MSFTGRQRKELRKAFALVDAGGSSSSGGLVSVTEATFTVDPSVHDNKTMILDRAAGIDIDFPEATGSGAKYYFYVATTVTTNSIAFFSFDSISFEGFALMAADGGSTSLMFEASGDPIIALDGSTTGGIAGDHIEIQDVQSGVYSVKAFLQGTGAEATPFSNGG